MGDIKQVSPLETKEWAEQGKAVLIDVRERDEFEEERISFAISHPGSSFFSEKVLEIAGGKLIIFHCLAGKRAEMACVRFMTETGMDARCMTGSLMGWKEADLPTEI